MWLPIEATRQGQTRGEDEHVSAAGRTRVGLVVVEAAETADERGFAWSGIEKVRNGSGVSGENSWRCWLSILGMCRLYSRMWRTDAVRADDRGP